VASLVVGEFRTSISLIAQNAIRFVAFGTPANFQAHAAANTDQILHIDMIVTITTAGNINFQFRSEVNTSLVTVKAQSWMIYEPIPQVP
jgi:hypothetical protein